jgi:pantetheine-phosphate adenylyltransferase
MIREGARLFDRLVVAVGVNPEKSYTFNLEQRLRWLSEIVKETVESLAVQGEPPAQVRVESFHNQFLAHFAQSIGASMILRGIRNENDYTYEHAMRHINSDLHGNITTVFLIPPRDLCEVSSSTVKGMIGPEGWQEAIHAYVPPCVFAHLERTHGS